MKTKDMLNLKVGDLIRIGERGDRYDEAATIAEVTSLDVIYRPGGRVGRARFYPSMPAERDGSAVIARTVKVIGRYQTDDKWRTYPASEASESEYSAREVGQLWTPAREAAFLKLRMERRAQREQDMLQAAARRERAAVERAAVRDRLVELVGDEPISGFRLQLGNGGVALTGTELVGLIELALDRRAAR